MSAFALALVTTAVEIIWQETVKTLEFKLKSFNPFRSFHFHSEVEGTEYPASMSALAMCAPTQPLAPVTNTTVSLLGVRPSTAAVPGGVGTGQRTAHAAKHEHLQE